MAIVEPICYGPLLMFCLFLDGIESDYQSVTESEFQNAPRGKIIDVPGSCTSWRTHSLCFAPAGDDRIGALIIRDNSGWNGGGAQKI